MLQKFAKLLALAYCCNQSRWRNARNAYLLHIYCTDRP